MSQILVVNIDKSNCDSVKYVRRQYFDEQIILNSIHTEFEIRK